MWSSFLPTVAAMDIDWNKELLDQLSFHWDGILRPRLDGLTDEQYRWEPVVGAWSVRPRSEARTSMAAGAGETVIDWDFPEPVPAPVTTIAWRLGHLIVDVFGNRAGNHFRDGPLRHAEIDWPLDAAGALTLLDHHHDAWVDGVRSLGADGLGRPCGPAEGPYAEAPFAALVLHINREALHHGAEIALMLDLYDHRNGGTS